MKVTNNQLKMLNKEQARFEFDNLLNDDPDFQAQWGYCEGSQTKINEYDLRVLTKEQENAFYKWCSVYDDTKHIKKVSK